ncbi:MAG: hypothetical protein ABIJ43_05370 [Candidatus Beckwithbacteria bacterium]
MKRSSNHHHILSYRVIIEPEKVKQKTIYNVYCPTLGLVDYGNSLQGALRRMKKLMKFHLECLIDESKTVPALDKDESFVGMTSVNISGRSSFAFG